MFAKNLGQKGMQNISRRINDASFIDLSKVFGAAALTLTYTLQVMKLLDSICCDPHTLSLFPSPNNHVEGVHAESSRGGLFLFCAFLRITACGTNDGIFHTRRPRPCTS